MASRKHTHTSRNAVPLNTVDDTYIKNVGSKYSLQKCDHNLIIFCIVRTYFMIKRVSYRRVSLSTKNHMDAVLQSFRQ